MLFISPEVTQSFMRPKLAAMLSAIREFVASGRPVYAECGGMIFLSQQLMMRDGTKYPMAGVLPFEIV
jgi:cobyrinic acid a,c-diamide synthase